MESSELETSNREAEHVLLETQEKLRGVAEGRQRLAVEAQVHQLLEAARSEENLSRMFHGWAAWC